MTLLNIVRRSDCVHLLTDGAGLNDSAKVEAMVSIGAGQLFVTFKSTGGFWFQDTTTPDDGTTNGINAGGLGNAGAAWLGSTLNVAGVATLNSGTAAPAGGSTAARLLFGTTAGFGIYYGSGAPTVSAAQGSIYIRSDGSSTSTRLYVNTSGSTTWTNFASAA
jgi:hypothetical protein